MAQLLRSFLSKVGLDTKERRSWAIYDVANSAFATTVMVAVLPIYFNDVLAAELPNNLRSAYWAYFSALSMIIVAVVSPSLGFLADVCGSKKRYLAYYTALGSLGCFALAALGHGQWLVAGMIFVITNFSFHVGTIFYEALLPHIADEDSLHTLSNSGYALGYLGGGIVLALNLLFITKYEMFGLPNTEAGIKLSFISVGIVWILFSIPLFRNVREPQQAKIQKFSAKLAFSAIFRLKETFIQLKKYPQVLLFLVSFWAYSDGVGTIMNMATIYGREVGIASSDLILAILLVQFIGVPAGFAFGPLTNKIGPKKALYMTLTVYTGVSIVGYFMTTSFHFWILAIGVALVQGANQAISRSLFASMVPASHSGEFFGLFSVWSRFSGLFGPLVFGLLAEYTGGSRLSVLFVVGLFIVGIVVLKFVDIEKGRVDALRVY
ncbi:MAG: MFS transporter [Oligoflexus sp.]|nr:MFS transporter [Oligoflexus sp.]